MALLNTLKQTNGMVFTTTPPVGATYIFNDGKFLDLNASKETVLAPECGNRDFANHLHMDDYLVRNELYPNYARKILVETDNVIALNDGSNYEAEAAYFCLPTNEPNKKQYDALLDWLTYVMTVSGTVQTEDRSKRRYTVFDFVTPNNETGYTPEQIVAEVKKMYK